MIDLDGLVIKILELKIKMVMNKTKNVDEHKDTRGYKDAGFMKNKEYRPAKIDEQARPKMVLHQILSDS